MVKHARARVKGKHRKPSIIGRILTMRRSSSAAGAHGKRTRDRANTERQAIEADRSA